MLTFVDFLIIVSALIAAQVIMGLAGLLLYPIILPYLTELYLKTFMQQYNDLEE